MRKRKLALLLVVALSAIGSAAVAALGTGGTPESAARIAAATAGPERAVRAFGLRDTSAVEVMSLRNGDSVAIASGPGFRCLVRTHEGRQAGEACAYDATVGNGEGITVSDECGSSGHGLMEITGLAPEGATEVRLRYSDGSAATAEVLGGAFKFDATNPKPGAPYPTHVEWVAAASTLGTAPLPVSGDAFCLPAE